MHTIEFLQSRIREELTQTNLSGKPAELYDPIGYVMSMSGKKLRPLLTLLACDLFEGNIEKALKPAIGLEVFHNFTLLHDDIMDNASIRRNLPTVHVKWNPNIAILSGDTMFVQACQLVMKVEDQLLRQVMEIFYHTAIEVCEGQQMDMNFETRTNVSIAEYEKMIELKTAVLLAACLKIGAIVGGASSQDAHNIYEFGKNIGIAFQLQDDILDVYGSKEKFGKEVGGDIVANKKTYLLLKAFEQALDSRQAELQHLMTSESNSSRREKVEAVTTIYNELGIKESTEKEMYSYFEKGMSYLNKISVSDEKKSVLRNFASSLMEREV
jgi:geranylgeranyl diphosphate synthase, type II